MAFILFIGLLLSPFIFWPNAPVPYEIPRVWFVNRWIELLMVVGILQIIVGVKNWSIKKLDGTLLISVFGFLLVAIISSIFGVDFLKSFWGNYYRDDGLFTLFHLVGLFIFLILFWQEKWKKYTAISISLGASVTSLWAVISGVRFFILNDLSVSHWVDGAIGVSFGQPKFLAGFLLIALPFTIYLLKISKVNWQRILFLFSIIVQTIAIAFTKSWGAAMGIGLLAILIIILCTKFQKRSLMILSLLFLITTAFGIWGRLQTEKGFVAEGRERIFRKVFTAALNKPILGWGWANADYAFENVDWPIHLDKDVYVDKAHSMILEVFATTGIVGLIFYLAILIRTGKILICNLKSKNRINYLWHETLFIAFILYLFHAQANVISIGEETIFWVVVGIVGSREIINRDPLIRNK